MGISMSLCMIVKNEEAVLNNCLSSAADLADEIIVVDTGSTDRTVEIARRYTDKVYHFKWIDDFAAARNYSFSLATKDYIMWLDADDIILPENCEKIKALKETLDPGVDCVLMRYDCEFDENGALLSAQTRERIVKRSAGFTWKLPIHETLDFFNSHYITAADITITHNHKRTDEPPSDRNLKLLAKYFENGGNDLKLMYYYGMELYHAGRIDEAQRQIERFFANGGHGQTIALESFHLLITIYGSNKDYNRALKLAKKCAAYLSGSAPFLCMLASFHKTYLGNIDEAMRLYNKALACPYNPNAFALYTEYYYANPHLGLAHCYLSLSRHKDALYHYEKALGYGCPDVKVKEIVGKLRKYVALSK